MELAGGDGDAAVLRRALEEAKHCASQSAKAWALRRAFDTIRQSRTRHGPYSDPSGPATTSVASRAKAAIQIGAPLYNKGDVSGCVREYRACCKALVVQLRAAALGRKGQDACASVELALSPTAAQASQRDQAWQLRHALDKVIAAASG